MFEDEKIRDNEGGRQSAGAGEIDNSFHGFILGAYTRAPAILIVWSQLANVVVAPSVSPLPLRSLPLV
jgi:hypothetical protein